MTYADIQDLHADGQTPEQIAAALNEPRHAVVDHKPGGYEEAATVLNTAEIATVLSAMEVFARSEHPHAGLIAHGLRKFSAGDLDFARTETQAMFASLPAISGGAVSPDVADRLMRVGIRTESDADRHNGGEPYTAGDVQALIDEHVASELRGTLANYLASKVQAVQDAIEAGAVTTEAGVDALLAGGK